jgi:hypothetical protein
MGNFTSSVSIDSIETKNDIYLFFLNTFDKYHLMETNLNNSDDSDQIHIPKTMIEYSKINFVIEKINVCPFNTFLSIFFLFFNI